MPQLLSSCAGGGLPKPPPVLYASHCWQEGSTKRVWHDVRLGAYHACCTADNAMQSPRSPGKKIGALGAGLQRCAGCKRPQSGCVRQRSVGLVSLLPRMTTGSEVSVAR